MQNEMPLKQIIDAALAKIGSVADVNTVIGSPIQLDGGITVIPFSKVTVGFASGGVDFTGKNDRPDTDPHFAGGNGAAVSVTPLGFIVAENGNVRILDLKHAESFAAPEDPVSRVVGAVNTVVDKAPEIIDKLKTSFGKGKKAEDAAGDDIPETT